MTSFWELKPIARYYVATVILIGAAVLAHSINTVLTESLNREWFFLAALTLLTGSFTVKIPSVGAHLSVSETFVFVSVLMFGPEAGTVTVLLECLIILFWAKHSGRVHKVFFNTGAPAISIWVASTLFFALSGIRPYSLQDDAIPLNSLFVPLLAFTSLYFLLNSWMVVIALAFESDSPPTEIWWKNFTWLSVNYFSGASVAALIVTYIRELNLSALAVIVPLLVVSYLTFRSAMGRMEDSNKHLSDLNRLYLSTIETLAMAIDAKDQITHGHIRRVQTYAVGLARQVGVTDEKLIKAIEAAALLHDMGKLAVPEYILNKPGKLSPAEFEKMKLHASVGADILSAIDFPYPVVPIVRHHHENWNGTGYPDGVKGTDIPIGARILSVVDCFDALTSDRPYRPALSDEDALAILRERRGTMYDPLMVDTFIRVYKEIAPQAPSTSLPREVLDEITTSSHPASGTSPTRADARERRASANEALVLYELEDALEQLRDVAKACGIISTYLARLVSFGEVALFTYDAAADELVVAYTGGKAASVALAGTRVELGQRLSGWVAANRQTILNSDPALDLGDSAGQGTRLRSCLSTPLVHADHLVGVLTLYAAQENAFTEDDRAAMEALAKVAAPAIKEAVAFELQAGRTSEAVAVKAAR